VLERLRDESPLIAYILNTLYQDHRLETDLRRYPHPVAPTLLDDELPLATLDALMTAVESHYPVAQRYFSLKAKALGLDQLATHDVLAPYPDGEREVRFDEARDEVLAAFDALSPRAQELARGFFDEGRIDAEARPGKRDGAFCAGMVPGVAPRVLVNFQGRLRDVFTLAHELGHGVHFALAAEKQSLLNYWPTSPMAETASVFGEMLLTRRLLGAVQDRATRRQLLAARIEEALGTIHRQVAFTRYERNAHDERARAVLTTERLCELWSAETGRLYGDAVARGPLDVWGWAGIPHLLHYRFYCYSYAFGQLLVFALYERWQREGDAFVPRYLELLAGGGGDTPVALLKPLGIDLTDPDFWRGGLEVVTRMVDEFADAV
jgi:oligoendopeptidase F